MLSNLSCCTVRETPAVRETLEYFWDAQEEVEPLALEAKSADAAVALQHGNTNGFSSTVSSKHLAPVAPEAMLWAIASIPRPWTLGVLLLIVASLCSLGDPYRVDGCKWVDCTVVIVSVLILWLAQHQLRWLQDRLKFASSRRPLPFSAATLLGSKPMTATGTANGSDAQALLALFEDRKLETPEDLLDEKTCKRFLVGWKGEFDGAAEGLRKYQTWKRSAKPALLTAADIPTEFASGKGYHHGFDPVGRPIIWAFASRHDKQQRDIEETVQLILFCLECAIHSAKCCSGEHPASLLRFGR